MNNRYWFEKLVAKFGEEFAEDFESLLEKHGLDEVFTFDEIYNVIQTQFDTEDVADWLAYYSNYPSLSDNEKFVNYLTLAYRKHYDSGYGTWDNISSAFNYIRNDPEWKDIIDAAEEDD